MSTGGHDVGALGLGVHMHPCTPLDNNRANTKLDSKVRLSAMPGFKFIKFPDLEALSFPLPDVPPKYALHIVARNNEAAGALDGFDQNQVRGLLGLDTAEIRLSVPGIAVPGTNPPLGMPAANALLGRTGLAWLDPTGDFAGLPLKAIPLSVSGNKPVPVVLPFVPEFAHDAHRADQLADGRFREIHPISAEFVPTLNCPFRCKQCSYRVHKIAKGVWLKDYDRDPSCHMELANVRVYVDRLKEAGVQYLVVTGGGEPLMNREVTLSALRFARERGMETGLYTNGYLLMDHDNVRDILEIQPEFVRVSVNAGSNKVHAKYHRPVDGSQSSFDKVMSGLELLARTRNELNRSTEIGASYLVSRDNVDDIASFAERIARIARTYQVGNGRSGIDFVRFTPAIEYFSDVQYDDAFLRQAFTSIHACQDVFADAQVEVVAFSRFTDASERRAYAECLGSSWFAEVSPFGHLYLCCEMDFFPGYDIGDLARHTIPEIWNSPQRDTIIDLVNRSGLRGCPAFCKPHQFNKVFHEIKKMLNERPRIRNWLASLLELHKWQANHDPRDPSQFFRKTRVVAF
jgi:sulfatase maturation enzyme AslB (radical SAM superfamily)